LYINEYRIFFMKKNLGNFQKKLLDVSEEPLDDFTAQSLNRNRESLLNPKKKYYIPV